MVTDGGLSRELRTYYGENQCPYFDTDLDDYFQFLGFVGTVDERGHLSATQKASSYLTNMLAPERSTRSQFRAFPWTGFSAREELYNADGSPATHEAQACFYATFRNHFNQEWLEIVRKGAAREGLGVSSWADRQALANPDSVHYLIDYSDVSPAIRGALGLTINGETLAKYLPHIYH